MDRSALPCPRCRIPLFIGAAAGMNLHACGGCGGVWLHSACARRLADHLPADAIRLAQVAAHHARHATNTAAAAACPVCAKPMTRSSVAMARVEIDVCGAHGTWYDRHELEAIAQAMQATRWRPPAQGPGGYPQNPHHYGAGAAMGTAAVAGAAVGAHYYHYGAAEVATDVAIEVGAEVAAEGAFEIVGAILGGLFG